MWCSIMRLKIGISPCPNDTFVFHALLKNLIDVDTFEFEVTFADVQSFPFTVTASVIRSGMSSASMSCLYIITPNWLVTG